MKFSVLFGTESGNAEIAAEDLAASLVDAHDVEVKDLADARIDELVDGRFVVLICSTYGEGDLPASALPFSEELVARAPDLTGVHYALFGLGDTFYEATYSHGADILDEKLSALGAIRVGEIGRHDASSWTPAGGEVLSWFESVAEQVAAVHVPS